MGGERTNDTVTHALEEYVARREQAKVVDLFGTMDWNESFDYKEARRLRDRKLGLID